VPHVPVSEETAKRPRRRFGALLRRWRARAAGKHRARQVDRTPDTRRKIVSWALVIGVACGFFNLPLPIEDTLRAARSAVRLHPADQSTVVVTVDDHTLGALGVADTTRGDDAKVVDALFAAGARRVFFDRAFADATSYAEDRKLVEAFERHRPNVFIGFIPDLPQPDGTLETVLPHERFRSHANIVSMQVAKGPFDLSAKIPVTSEFAGRRYRSLSAELAEVEPREGRYRVDYSIDYATIPTVSYIAILRGEVSRDVIAGRDVVIAPSSRMSNDYHGIPYRGKILGALINVIGAETLKNGQPRDFGWLPAFAFAGLLLMLQSRQRRPSTRLFAGFTLVLLAAPIAPDIYNWNFDVMPALIAVAIGWVRLHRLANETYRGSTGLQRIEVLQDGGVAAEMDVVALKIRNFATISANLAPDEVEELLAKARAMLRTTDPVAEIAFDKDTFVWLRPRVQRAELENHARGLHAMFRTSITIGAHAPDVASSIGIDTIHGAPLRERTENAIQSAEDAAHSNRIFVVSEPALAADRAWRLQILSELEAAIRNDEVEVVFQPKVSLTSECIIGAEALLRWQHPVRGTVDPAVVIASAEEHNRVDMITQFVLNRALREARRAIARDPAFKVAVNISALDLRDPAFLGQIERLIARYRFPAANLVLEITETAPIENDAVVAATLASLKRSGVRLSVDDFGIGHASLHYLRQIPSDEVKIDRSFVVGMESSPEDRALVRTAIDMIHSLGRSAVAEGVENGETVELLREMGCDTAQGYFYYRPITMDTLLTRLPGGAVAA